MGWRKGVMPRKVFGIQGPFLDVFDFDGLGVVFGAASDLGAVGHIIKKVLSSESSHIWSKRESF